MTNGDAPYRDLVDAIAQGRAVNLCIHNQMAFLMHDTREYSAERDIMASFCYGLADFCHWLAPYMMTVNAQFDIAALNEAWEHESHRHVFAPIFKGYHPKAEYSYDSRKLRASKSVSAQDKVSIDVVDFNPCQHVFIDDSSDVFAGSKSAQLIEFMRDNRKDTVICHGLYASGCIPFSLNGAISNNFKTYVVTDKVFNHPYIERYKATHAEWLAQYPADAFRIDSRHLMKAAVASCA